MGLCFDSLKVELWSPKPKIGVRVLFGVPINLQKIDIKGEKMYVNKKDDYNVVLYKELHSLYEKKTEYGLILGVLTFVVRSPSPLRWGMNYTK